MAASSLSIEYAKILLKRLDARGERTTATEQLRKDVQAGAIQSQTLYVLYQTYPNELAQILRQQKLGRSEAESLI